MGSLQHTTVDIEQAAGERRDRLLSVLGALASGLESRAAVAVLLLTILYVPVVLMEAHGRLLSADELYTLHIARAPTIRSMLHLARETDLHPPLSYVLERYALRLPGPRWVVARLPNLLCGLLATAMLFQFASRRMGRLYGYVAVAVLWFRSGDRVCLAEPLLHGVAGAADGVDGAVGAHARAGAPSSPGAAVGRWRRQRQRW